MSEKTNGEKYLPDRSLWVRYRVDTSKELPLVFYAPNEMCAAYYAQVCDFTVVKVTEDKDE